ncbi:MAG: aspartyl-phosphate phosphatase Spo0E family protein [Firmicutes bacterium]|nr:aspartyl-phosphate phosphatase Spo0E family protein [Bacillota bacterium]
MGKLRTSMVSAVGVYGFKNQEVIKLSRKLDNKIVDYYKVKSK